MFRYLLYCWVITVTSCISSNQPGVIVEVERPELPVLVKKNASPAIKLNFIRTDTAVYTLRKIELDLTGTTSPGDILAVNIYETDPEGLIDKDKPVFTDITSPHGKKLVFTKEITVTKDTLSLWVAFTLKDEVNLNHRIGVSCKSVTTSLGELKIADEQLKPLRIGVAVRQKNQNGVAKSRIPGLEISNNGTLFAVFDARHDSDRDLQGNMDIGLHRSFDGGKTWEPLQIVLDMGEWGGLPQTFNGVSDACILVDRNTGHIYIAGLWMHGLLDDDGKWTEGLNSETKDWKFQHQWVNKASQPGFGVKETCQFLITKSTDDGKTWSRPVNITSTTKRREWWLFAPAPGHGITMNDGTLVFPTQGRDEEGKPFSNITYSKDGGKTWITSNPVSGEVTECMAVELSDGAVMLNMRDNRNKNNLKENGRRVCVTADMGKTWTEHPTSHKVLTEPTCMASLHKHIYTDNGQSMLLFANPNHPGERKHITLKASFDEGNTWPEDYWIVLDDLLSWGYTCITSVDEETIGILYESSQADLAYIQVKTHEIFKRKKQDD